MYVVRSWIKTRSTIIIHIHKQYFITSSVSWCYALSQLEMPTVDFSEDSDFIIARPFKSLLLIFSFSDSSQSPSLGPG